MVNLTLRGVEQLDGQFNPYLLSPEQNKAVKWLKKLNPDISANNVTHIDLSYRVRSADSTASSAANDRLHLLQNLGENKFEKTVMALSLLPVISLNMNNNPCVKSVNASGR